MTSKRNTKPNLPATHPENEKFLPDLCQLITSQLIASAPASLPSHIITKGIRCLSNDYSDHEIAAALENLVSAKNIVKVSECGFCDRYQLALHPAPGSHKGEGN